VGRPLPVQNPQNRFDSTFTEWDVESVEDIPRATLHVYEDRTRNILATNDSPDVGFRWSVNPYRGCTHACAYCLDGDTLILMADGSQRALRDVRVGDEVIGTERRGHYRRFARSRVLAHWATVKPAVRVRLSDGTELIASPDHRFLTERGWKHVLDTERGRAPRPHLTTSNAMLGFGQLEASAPATAEYERGYLTGMIRGDAHLASYAYQREGRTHGDQHHFRLALVDIAGLARTRDYLARLDVATRDFVFAEASGSRQVMHAIRTSSRDKVEAIRRAIAWPEEPTREWQRGFLAGIFDAEGSSSCGILRISNGDEQMLAVTCDAFAAYGFDAVLEPPHENGVRNVRVRGGMREHLRFFQLTDPAIRRKCSIEGRALKQKHQLDVVAVEPLGFDMMMFDITTTTEDFLANGIVSHNCYARPSHEYLSFGAGTDFEKKIVMKPDAPALLREAFDKKSWKGELVVFSGVTDCYQPLEGKMGLTRGCLEVCLEYKNPVGLITKSPIIERDIDLLSALAKEASVRVSVSIPFWKKDIAKAMEPYVTTPERRMKIVERLAAAGIPVGVSVSPIVPGLNDEDVGEVLQHAKDAGATHAFYVLLRLPGAVANVFEERLRKELPLRADKVMNRIRETRGGKVYDTRWSARQTGEGVYAEMIATLFEKTAKRLGLRSDEMVLQTVRDTFRRPDRTGQTSFGF
jgi:DNA repair photolyase